MATFRLPSSLPPPPSSSPSLPAPPLTFLLGSWNVTHSTLPMWKSSRNVRITYSLLPPTSTSTSTASPPHLDDVVTYQSLSSTAIKSVHGVDKPFDVGAGTGTGTPTADGETASLGYNWRGKGWLMIASSKWEILGYGDEEGLAAGSNTWVVTYFAKTLFTPAGVDIYSRKGTLRPETVESIKAGLATLGGGVADLAGQLFDVAVDGDRQD